MTLSGYKTYLIGALLVVLAGLHAQGYLPDGTYLWLRDALLGGGLAALRAGVAKSNGGAK